MRLGFGAVLAFEGLCCCMFLSSGFDVLGGGIEGEGRGLVVDGRCRSGRHWETVLVFDCRSCSCRGEVRMR